MAARTFDIYDLSSQFIPATAPPTAAQRRAFWQELAENRLFNASVILLVFASFVYLVGTMLGGFPFGRVTGTQNLALWLTVITFGLAVAGVITALLVTAVMQVRK